MNNYLPKINPKTETVRITKFIQATLKKTGKKNVVIGLSGGIDSTTSLFLLNKTLKSQQIHVAHLSYFSHLHSVEQTLQKLNIPKENIHMLSIKSAVDAAAKTLSVIPDLIGNPDSRLRDNDKIRLGNIMARMRMVFLYDLAKKYDGLVCGTENKSEYYLSYFTRFGDEASDFEPIRHLYKTQVYELATYLGVPQEVINQLPTAGLWEDQTDEDEFGFSYAQADQVLYLYFDKRLNVSAIEKKGLKNAKKIIQWAKNNHFKHEVPYVL